MVLIRYNCPKCGTSLQLTPSFQLGGRSKTLSFLPFYGGTDGDGAHARFLLVDEDGMTVLHGADAATFEMMPALGKPKGFDPISLCVTHATDQDHPTRSTSWTMPAWRWCGKDPILYVVPQFSI